jgi:hypothetical protein
MNDKNNARAGETATGEIVITDGEMMHKDIPDFPILIGPGTDLNAIIPADNGAIPPVVFDNLPAFLGDACAKLDQSEREVFLVCALGVLSACLPNIHGHYDGKFYSPHLFVYLLGGYGTGKGSAEIARALGAAIHQRKREEAKTAFAQYAADMAEWNDAPTPKGTRPAKPKQTVLFIPADNRRGGTIQLLDENEGSGIIFETEADTVTDSIAAEHGSFSDIFRKAFHHEPVTLYRKTDNEFRDIPEPKLAVVLTSTPDQSRRLIPSAQNGLFSRFIFYHLKAETEFRDVFDRSKKDRPAYFQKMGEDVLETYDRLAKYRDNPLEFELRENQQVRFLKLFKLWKAEFNEMVDADMTGTANRLGLICFRLAMILTAVRSLWDGEESARMVCSDQDFETALRLVEVFKRNALRIYWTFPKVAPLAAETTFEKGIADKQMKMAQAKALSNQGKNPREIEKEIGVPKSTVFRWLYS